MARVARKWVALLVPVAIIAPSTQAWAASWQIQPSANPSSTQNYLQAVTATASTNAWAVGSFTNGNGTDRTLIEHFDGTSWTKVASPNSGTHDNELLGVRAPSATDIWAVGDHLDAGGTVHPLIEHFDGTSWSVRSSPDQPGAKLLAVGASSSTNAWAVGYFVDGTGAFSEHYDGTAWTVVSTPTLNWGQLWGVTTTGASSAWSVGYYLTGSLVWKTVIEHYDGTSWSVVPSPNQSSTLNYLNAVSANSSSDIWAVGEYVHDSDQKLRTSILHYNGASWKLVTHPDRINGDYLISVKAVSSSDVWAVGASMNSLGAWRTLIMRYDGSAWAIQTSPNGAGADNHLTGVAATSSTNAFAVGWDGTVAQSTKTLAMHCAC